MIHLIHFAELAGLYRGFTDLLLKLSLIIIFFFAPLQGLLLTLLFLIVLDLITGLWAAKKTKNKITSARLSRTATKILVYFFTITIVNIVSKHIMIGSDLPITEMISSFIILTEFQSILENVYRISKQNVLILIIDKLSLVTKGRNTGSRKKKSY